jgi:hypothetical protein
VARRIPEERLRTTRQKLWPVELAFVLKSITLRLIDAGRRGKGRVTLAHEYFCCKKTVRSFERAANATLNREKLRLMLNLLEQEGFIRRENWRTRPAGQRRRFGSTTYRFGPRPLELPSTFGGTPPAGACPTPA